MSGQRCPKCGGYSWDNGKCKYCGHTLSSDERILQNGHFKPRFNPLDDVDVDKLIKGLKDREEQSRRNAIPRLSDCPYFNEHSLYYNSIADRFECMNIKKPCAKYNHPILPNTLEYQNIIDSLKK